VVDVWRRGDHVVPIKLVLDSENLNVVSAYAPQIGLGEDIKRRFWEEFNAAIQNIPLG